MADLNKFLTKEPKKQPTDLSKFVQEDVGFLKGAVQGIASPFLKAASTAASVGRGVFKLGEAGVRRVLGDKKGAQIAVIEAGQPVEFGAGYLGRGVPIESLEEAIGAGVQIGLTVITPQIGASPTIAGKAAQFGALGAGFGAGKALEEGAGPAEVIKQTFISGLTGAAVGGAVGVVGKGTRALVQKAPERLFNSALKITQKVNQATRSPSKALIDKGVFGTLGRIKRDVLQGINNSNAKIEQLIRGSQATVKSKQLINQAVKELQSKFGASYNRTQLNDTVRKLPIARLLGKSNITINEVNRLRMQLDRQLGSRFFLSQSQAPLTKEAMGVMSHTLRNTVKNTLPSTRKVFADFSTYLQAEKAVNRAIAISDKKLGFGLFDLILGTGVGATGGLPAAAGAVAARKALAAPATKTTSAILLNKLGKIPVDKAGKVAKTAVLNLIKEITD